MKRQSESPPRVRLTNVAFSATEDDVREWLSSINVTSIEILKRGNGKSKGVAVVGLAGSGEVAKALARNDEELSGRKVKVRVFEEQPSKYGGGGVAAPGQFAVRLRDRTVLLPFGRSDPKLADASKEAVASYATFDATERRGAVGAEHAARAVEVLVCESLEAVDAGVAALRSRLAAGDGAVRTADGASIDCLGFDTETKPVFRKGQAPNTVALVQMASRSLVVLFRLSKLEGSSLPESLRALVEDPAVLLVGVGCSGDERSLRKRCRDLDARGTLFDLEQLAKARYPGLRSCGLRGLVASCSQQKLSKAQNTANWELAEYTPAMVKYAANDAAAGLYILDLLLLEPAAP